MPLQLDNIFSLGTPQKESFINRVFSNPYYTAAAITVLTILVLAIFFPIERKRSYFKLFIHLGILNTLVMILHDSHVSKEIEKSYESEVSTELPDKISVSPLTSGGHEQSKPEVSEPTQEALEEIISALENDI